MLPELPPPKKLLPEDPEDAVVEELLELLKNPPLEEFPLEFPNKLVLVLLKKPILSFEAI